MKHAHKGTKMLAIMTSLALMAACTLDGKRKADAEPFSFYMADDTELFFRNVRAIYYDRAASPDGRQEVFRWSNRPPADAPPFLLPTLILNSREDAAYLLLEANAALEDEDVVTVRVGDSATFELRERGRAAMLDFATQVYDGLQQGQPLFIRVQGEWVSFLSDTQSREAFRIPMTDYYRLTRAL